MRKREAEARKIRREGRRDKGEACQVGGGGDLDSGPEFRQIQVQVWLMRNHSIFLSLSLVRISVLKGQTALNCFPV